MNQIISLSSLTAKELKTLIPQLGKSTYTSADISHNSSHIIKLLASLKTKHTYNFMKTIDTFYHGMSFHYIMETKGKLDREHNLFLYRIAYHVYSHPNNSLFQPMRQKLITNLLFSFGEESDKLSPILEEANNAISSINAISFLTLYDKEDLSNRIFTSSFERYFLQISLSLPKITALPVTLELQPISE